MKITDITLTPLTTGKSLLRIQTDAGVEGWAEALGRSVISAYVEAAVKPALIGENPLDINRHWGTLALGREERVYRLPGNIVGTVDIALWDLLGKEAGLPVHTLMGGAVRRKIPLYWSTGSGWLQVIKGWLENGEEQHKVWDVVCADGRTADASGRCSATAADPDLETCAQRNDVGAAELTARFVDPDFAADQRAFYYIRVLENPSCRWTNWLANSAGVALPNDVPATLQNRAWTSPIWIEP